jgi:thioredoxin-like negative regulator of GroEL
VASTPEVDPPFRISYLDRVQARSLDRAARGLAARGLVRDAMATWRSAAANDPANLGIYRAVVETLGAQDPVPRSELALGLSAGRELLKRSGTNEADALRLARLYSAARVYDLCVPLMEGFGKDRSPEMNRLYAEALFITGSMSKLGVLVDSHPDDLAATPASRLLVTAWKAAWGPPVGMQAARRDLAAARQSLESGTTATQFQLFVSSELSDLATYKDALDQLSARHEDQPMDHVRYWGLLVGAGRTSEAAALARRFTAAPASPAEAAGMAAIFDALGMTRYAADFGLQQLAEFPFAPNLWITCSQLLKKLQSWKELQEVAVRMRSETSLNGGLSAFSWFLEGYIDLQSGRKESAEQSFNQIRGSRFPTPELAVQTAIELRKQGHPKIALEILLEQSESMSANPEFWFETGIAAYEAADMTTLAKATETAYRLDPSNSGIANNRAAVLIATETQPEEAVTLTLQLFAQNSASVDLLLNHVLALINASRIEDAEFRMRPLATHTFNPAESTVYHLARFRIAESRNDTNAMLLAAESIQPKHLLPPQAARLEKSLARIRPKE